MRFISELKDGDRVIEHFLCKQKQQLKSKSGKSYLSLKLLDKTGVLDAKVWELNNSIQSFEENDFIKVDGNILVYQNDLQLKVNKIRRSEEGEYNPNDYIPATDKNVNELYQQIVDYVDSVTNPFIKKLLEGLLIENDEVVDSFKKSSAAKNMHHNYLGGLIEHTLSVTQACDFYSTQYPYANRDILIAMALLHDIGKVYELSEFPQNEYTDVGQLIGHIIIGAEMITDEAKKIPGFPPKLLSLMKHCMLSHHGELEFGSPKRPKIVEAFLLHQADDTDAKIWMYEDMIKDDKSNGPWVGYHKMLARNIRKTEFDE